ncbi:MAG: serine--tRNA ligase, partial [Planctomycetales bacterium]|nr:serine--tRNA ligase [Planctomycetales bacterium]
MLDRKFIVENVSAVKKNCDDRGMKADVDRFVELDELCRSKLNDVQELNRQANEVSKSIGKAKDADEREARKDEGRRLREQKDAAQADHDQLLEELIAIQRAIPNMAHPDAPIGVDDKSNLEVGRGSTAIREFDFKALDHVELSEKHNLIDFASAAKTTGTGFYFLRNDGVLLDYALQRYALDVMQRHGFDITTTPDLARNEILEGIGFNPRSGEETQVYSVADSELSLIG